MFSFCYFYAPTLRILNREIFVKKYIYIYIKGKRVIIWDRGTVASEIFV